MFVKTLKIGAGISLILYGWIKVITFWPYRKGL